MRTWLSMLLGICLFTCCAAPLQAEEDNWVIVTDNGLEMFHWDLDFVRNAQESIEISAVFMGGKIARELLTTIEARLDQVPGLQVHILTTPTLLEKGDLALIKRLEKNYPNNFHLEHASTVAMVWPDVSGIDNHAKMFIVDEKYFSVGGTNLDDSQCSEGTWTPEKNYEQKHEFFTSTLPSGVRDQDVVGCGPLASELRRTFFKLYALWEHFNKTGRLERDPDQFARKSRYFPVFEQGHDERFEVSTAKRMVKPRQTRVIIGGPHQKQNAITQEYVRLIDEAKEEIIIANLYFSPAEAIFDALLAAVNRGVKLTILGNGLSDISPEYNKYFMWANRMNYVPMFYGATFHFWDAWTVPNLKPKNTRIYEYNVKDILLHKKIMIVDGKRSLVGSYNFGMRSDIGDYEMVVRIDSAEVGADLKKVHLKDLKYSRPVSVEEARSWYFDPVTAYLGEMQKRFHGFF